jgi:addiction module RelB/DinJ family antitoxin
MNTTLQIRIDKKAKDKAKKIFAANGLDISSGIKLLIAQVVRKNAIPAEFFTADNYSLTKKTSLVRDAQRVLRKGVSYKNARVLHDKILAKR